MAGVPRDAAQCVDDPWHPSRVAGIVARMSLDLDRELQVGLDAVRRAMGRCQLGCEHLLTPDTLTHNERSPVTLAAFASQAIVCSALAEAFPIDPVVGEEGTGELRQPEQQAIREAVVQHVKTVVADADEPRVLDWIDRGAADGTTDRYWTLDPIDGTKGFLRGEQYAVALALLIDHRVALGILGCPNLAASRDAKPGAVLFAVRGRGTWLADASKPSLAPMRIAPMVDLPASAARFCESVESGHSDQSASQRIASLLGITSPPLRMDSQVKYAAVALSQAHIYLRLPTKPGYREKIWDHAAGAIVVEEAGGQVSDTAGKPLDFTHGRHLEANPGIVATHGVDHARVVGAISQVESESKGA